jgi:nitrous oxide reductase accessory protein NosL
MMLTSTPVTNSVKEVARNPPFPSLKKGAGRILMLRLNCGETPLPPNKLKPIENYQIALTRGTVLLVMLLLIATPPGAAEQAPVKPGPTDKCPVCGMFVAKYPDWIAEIVFTDGSVAFFDGVKDMLKYYFNLKKYNPSKTQADIRAVFVMDYYAVEFIDGRRAFYVSGSDIYGPMGKELIPFEKEAQAQEFLKDHKAKAVLRFGEIDAGVMKGLD